MGWCNDFGWGFGPGFLWIIIWVGISWLFWGRRGFHRWDRKNNSEQSPADILAERFAKGEIDEEEYKKKIDVLKKHS